MIDIAARMNEEIQKAQKRAEEVIKDFKNKLASGETTREELANSQAQSDIPTDPTQKQAALDQSVICSVACCCNQYPNQGSADQNLYQACVHGVYATADAALNYKSRYKSEVSFDMGIEIDGIPRLFMHRDPNNPDYTEPSHNWMARIKEVEGYQPGEGYIRSPDLTVVKNPAKPPTVDNIEKVIEYKFKEDRRDIRQDEAYEEIAGGRKNYAIYGIGGQPQDREAACNCKNPGQII
ncbi:hypothetical protein NBRC116591_23360 [Sessilibacter corallicola]|uniref:VRR-NUC domain-containing protein n=2 Tax=Sessilibacter corallicola TaxID=2904075 RepID=A0ABQ0AA94_9GAMM